jgi:hypothetical protein
MSLYPTAVSFQSARFLGRTAAHQHPARLGVSKITLTELGHRKGVPLGPLLSRRVRALYNLTEHPPSFVARFVRRPRHPVPPNGVPPLPPVRRTVFQDVGNAIALSPRAESGNRTVLYDPARCQRPHLAQTDLLAARLRHASGLVATPELATT